MRSKRSKQWHLRKLPGENERRLQGFFVPSPEGARLRENCQQRSDEERGENSQRTPAPACAAAETLDQGAHSGDDAAGAFAGGCEAHGQNGVEEK